MRKILCEAGFGKSEDFSPLPSSFQAGITMAKGPYIDKLGRSYRRWTAGRRNKTNIK